MIDHRDTDEPTDVSRDGYITTPAGEVYCRDSVLPFTRCRDDHQHCGLEAGRGEILEAYVQVLDELLRLCGPVCEFDQKRATEHKQPLITTPRSFFPLPPKVEHSYEACADCDALSGYHHDDIEHCRHCDELPHDCDGTPEIQPARPPHPPSPEIEAWLREHSR